MSSKTKTTFTFTADSGWALFWSAVRVVLLVFIALNAPWYVTALAALMQVKFKAVR